MLHVVSSLTTFPHFRKMVLHLALPTLVPPSQAAAASQRFKLVLPRVVVSPSCVLSSQPVASYATKLESYTMRVPSEVLLVHAVVDDEEDQVLVFKGFSSSLMRPTSSDLSEDILPATAVVKSIDRIQVPYNPTEPNYIQKDLSWEDFLEFVNLKGL